MADFSDQLFTLVGNQVVIWPNVYVRLTSNALATTYISTAPTSPTGTFTISPRQPADIYTVATGPTATGPWTNTTLTNYSPGYVAGDQMVAQSVTSKTSSPYVPTAPAGTVGGIYFAEPNTTAIQAAITAAGATGAEVFIRPGTVAVAAGNTIAVTLNTRVIVRAWGVTFQPAANTDVFKVSQGNSQTAAGMEIHGATIDGQNLAGTVGFRVRDTDRTILRDCRIGQCTTGIQVESFTALMWAEENAIMDTLIYNCTTGINFSAPGGTGSLGETQAWNLGISGCTTGIAINNPATFYRCRLFGVTIWIPTNGTGMLIDSNVTDSSFLVDFENLNGTATGITGVSVTVNAVGIPTLDAHFGFTGTFANKVVDSTNKGIVWTEGRQTLITASANTAGAHLYDWLVQGDTVPRVFMAGGAAGGGAIQFGDGTTSDSALSRLGAAHLGINVPLDVTGRVGSNVGATAAVWDSPSGPHQWKNNNTTTIMTLSALGVLGFTTVQYVKQAPAFAASPAPDFTLGGIYAMAALTGNVTVANPVNSTQGMRVLLIWTQDGTGGRTVTYSGTNWRSVGIAAQTTTLSTVTIDEAVCVDGTIWRVNRLVTGQTI